MRATFRCETGDGLALFPIALVDGWGLCAAHTKPGVVTLAPGWMSHGAHATSKLSSHRTHAGSCLTISRPVLVLSSWTLGATSAALPKKRARTLRKKIASEPTLGESMSGADSGGFERVPYNSFEGGGGILARKAHPRLDHIGTWHRSLSDPFQRLTAFRGWAKVVNVAAPLR